MSPPRPLGPDVTVPQLAQWLTEWSLLYPFAYDEKIRPILRPVPLAYTVRQLEPILEWKLGKRWVGTTLRLIHEFERDNPGAIEQITSAAFTAPDDNTAMKILSQNLPRVKAAVGSAILMAANPERWCVMDRQANEALVRLRDLLRGRQLIDLTAPLHTLALALDAYTPPGGPRTYVATRRDWPAYMAICRDISEQTLLSLRTIDRALYGARNV